MKTKQSMFVLFPPVHANSFTYENTHVFLYISPIIHTKTTENADRNDSTWRFFRHQSLDFHLHASTLEI